VPVLLELVRERGLSIEVVRKIPSRVVLFLRAPA
jgi:hypothetical protein